MSPYLQVEDLSLFNIPNQIGMLKYFNHIPICRNGCKPSFERGSNFNRSISLSDVGSDQFILVSELIFDSFTLGLDVEPLSRTMEYSLKKEIERHSLFEKFSPQFSTMFPRTINLDVLFWVWIEALYKSNSSLSYLLSCNETQLESSCHRTFSLRLDFCISFFYFDKNWLISMVKNYAH